jgi:hypothetical protein
VVILNAFRVALLLVVWSLPCSALSNTLLIKHATSLHQAAASYYMYFLTQGDKRYFMEYLDSMAQSQHYFKSLIQDEKNTADTLNPYWDSLYMDRYSSQGEVNVPAAFRNKLRKYIDIVSTQLELLLSKDKSAFGLLSSIRMDMDFVCSRFFDVSSSPYGAASLAANIKNIDPIEVSRNIKMNVNSLKAMALAPDIINPLKQAMIKWNFIESGTLDYTLQPPYMLVHFQKMKIDTLLSQMQTALLKLNLASKNTDKL